MKSKNLNFALALGCLLGAPLALAQIKSQQVRGKGTDLGNSVDGLIDLNNPQPYLRFREPVKYVKVTCTIPQLKNTKVESGRYLFRAFVNGDDIGGYKTYNEAFTALVEKTRAELYCIESTSFPQSPSELPQVLDPKKVAPELVKGSIEIAMAAEYVKTSQFELGVTQYTTFKKVSGLNEAISALRPANSADWWTLPLTNGQRNADAKPDRMTALFTLKSWYTQASVPDYDDRATLSYLNQIDLKAVTIGAGFDLKFSLKPSITYVLTRKHRGVFDWVSGAVDADTTADGDRFIERLNDWVNSRIPTGLGSLNGLLSLAQALKPSESFDQGFEQFWPGVVRPLLDAQVQNPFLKAAGHQLIKFGSVVGHSRQELKWPAKVLKPSKAEQLWSLPTLEAISFGHLLPGSDVSFYKDEQLKNSDLELAIEFEKNKYWSIKLDSPRLSIPVEGLVYFSWTRDREELLGIQAAVTNGMRLLNRVWPNPSGRLGKEGCNAVPGIARSIGHYKTLYFDPISDLALDNRYSRSAYVEQVLTVLDNINQVSYQGESPREFLNKTLPDWQKVCFESLGSIEAELKKFE